MEDHLPIQSKTSENERSLPTSSRSKRPNAGSGLRLPAQVRRQRFLEAEVSESEHAQIMEYCLSHRISVSQFLADLILEDATSTRIGGPVVRLRDLDFSAEEYEKLELLAYLHKKQSVSDLVRELLRPHLDLQRVHVAHDKTKSLRFYLDDQEHGIVTDYLTRRGITARKYVSYLALKTIAKSRKKRK
jgi:hypothetical protein